MVDVKTDYVPGVEFVALRVERDGEVVAERAVAAGEDFLSGQRAVTLEDVRDRRLSLRVGLVDPDSRVLADRHVGFEVPGGVVGATVIITRNCRDISCESGRACLDGRCVDGSCTPETPERCPPAGCASPADCRSGASCARPVCEDGTCLLGGGGCGAGEYCDPEIGCLPVPDGTRRDAGAPDGGSSDAGVPDAGVPDAGPLDAGVPAVCVEMAFAGTRDAPGTAPPTPPVDGRGSEARFGAVTVVRTDRSTGTLVVYDGTAMALRRVALDGEVTTLLTPEELCPAASVRAGHGVDSSGAIHWRCSPATIGRRDPDGTVTHVPLTGVPSGGIVQGLNVGRDDRLYVVGSASDGGLWRPFVLRVSTDGTGEVVWTPSDPLPALSVPTDIVVAADSALAYMADPNFRRIRRIDLVAGVMTDVLSPPGVALVTSDQRLALDGAGRLYTTGLVIAPGGLRVAELRALTAQTGIDVIGPDDDVVQADCATAMGWACELILFSCR